LIRRLFARARPRAARHRDPRDPSTILFAALVIGWWMTLAGIITLLLAEPAASASRGAFRPMPGVQAHISLPGMKALPIPVSRLGFDEANRGFAESDEAAIEFAFAVSEWIEVSDRTAVRIVVEDGDAVQIEILDGPWAGRQGWMKPRQLGP
jgi:hypothetical protein